MNKVFLILIIFCCVPSNVLSQNAADIDPTFTYINGAILDPGSGHPGGSINSIDVQLDGKIIIGGDFIKYNNVNKVNIARLNSDGTLDTSFLLIPDNSTTNGSEVFLSDSVEAIKVLNDGRIMVGGKFWNFPSTSSRKLIYLNSNGGVLSTGYYSGNGADNDIYCVASNPITGDTYFGGNLTIFDGNFSNYIGGKYSNGYVITGGTTTNRANGSVKSIAVQSNGKLIIGGSFTSYDGITKNGITRLNNNLTIDNTFNIGTGFNVTLTNTNTVYSILIQPNGKIIVGGKFASFNGSSRNNITRLNSDGTLDTSFNTGLGVNGPVNTIALQSNGKIIIGGNFTSFNGISIKNIARLNSDGTLDYSFDPGFGPDFSVNTITLQSDGKILVGGIFYNYKGIPRNGIVRLYGDSVLGIENQSIKNINIFPNPANDKFIIDFGSQIISNYSIKINNFLGQEVYSAVLDKAQFEVYKTWQGDGLYFVKIYDDNHNLVTTRKIIFH